VTAIPARGPLDLHLRRERFRQMNAELSGFRIEALRPARDPRHPGSILQFVRGLRVSAHLVYAIRDQLHGSELEAHWGHLIGADGITCSPECDVIIHRKGPVRHWNGSSEPVMDFWFVDSEHAVAVVSCKSLVESVGADIGDYCQKVKRYVARLAFFAECCPQGKEQSVAESVRQAGYEMFSYLYSHNDSTGFQQPNEPGWDEFIEWVEDLK
jgi:hypothetical protein